MAAEKHQKIVRMKPGVVGWQTPNGSLAVLGDVLGHMVSHTPVNQKVPDAEGMSELAIQTGLTTRASISLRSISPALEAALTGGTLTLTGSKFVRVRDRLSISTSTVTLQDVGDTGITLDAIMQVKGTSNGNLYTAVTSSSEVAGESYSLSGGVLTFHASETETEFLITYLMTRDATADVPGEKIVINPDDKAQKLRLVLFDIEHDAVSKTDVSHHLYDMQRCVIDSEIPSNPNGQVRDIPTFDLQFHVENLLTNDVVSHRGYPHVTG